MVRTPQRSTLSPYTTLLRPASDTTDPSVTLRPPPPDLPAPLVSPLGQLTWVQRRAPLGLLLQRIGGVPLAAAEAVDVDRKSTRLNSSHANISYAVFCLKKKN